MRAHSIDALDGEARMRRRRPVRGGGSRRTAQPGSRGASALQVEIPRHPEHRSLPRRHAEQGSGVLDAAGSLPEERRHPVIQVALFVAIHLLGLAFAVAFGPHHRAHRCCALAFLIGLVLWVVALFAALCAGISPGVATVASLYMALLTGFAAVGARRRRFSRALARPIIGWTAGLALVACG